MTDRKGGLLSMFRRRKEIPTPWVPAELPVTKTPPAPAPEIVKPPATAPWVPPASWPKPTPPARPRLVFAVDATSSRAPAWEAKKKLTNRFLAAMPAELDVALAFHGGNKLHTFTPFLPDAGELRKIAAKVRCKAGYTRLLDILARVAKEERVRVVVYIGDVFEESERKALRLADALLLKETRVIILHDTCSRDFDDGEMFKAIAERTGGAVLPFDYSSLERLGELLETIAVLAVGGITAVEEKQSVMPAATVLLENLDPKRLLIGRR